MDAQLILQEFDKLLEAHEIQQAEEKEHRNHGKSDHA